MPFNGTSSLYSTQISKNKNKNDSAFSHWLLSECGHYRRCDLEQWGVDIKAAKPVTLKKLVVHGWSTGEVKSEYVIGDYKVKFGTPDYNNFKRIYIHKTTEISLRRACHRCRGRCYPIRKRSATADLIVAADGIRSSSRGLINCGFGLDGYISNESIEYWGGFGIDKIAMSRCSNDDVVSCYCFYPAAYNELREDGWNISTTPQQLVDTFPDLDPRMKMLMLNAEDIKMWHLYRRQPYPYRVKGKFCLLGDAAHPMMPDQSQGSCMASEDAGALGLIFNRTFREKYSITKGLGVYQALRKPRATHDLSERIGWSSSADRPGKLTIGEICGYDMQKHLDELLASNRR
ncbi:FAD-dependent oxidoreductase [Aspergillus alliaceus]|uniref:FAD-dependent oxidoreductase n=1 Tax=Petromyces alliaceus TaxID=209559 RepID=UPI0012A72667|nr:uncharacterized protein BDW43DRAFT_304340 [Aspergillus alliaceus]KAB8227789.1 hypothetical protein BDW43DRAFT_304340 [Aspergillus alliaceus]